MNKAQAAFEFLTTYVWAFLALSITLGTLYYYGIFDFAKYAPETCFFTSQIKCTTFSLNPTQVRIKLVNNIGEDLNVTSFGIADQTAKPLVCSSYTPALAASNYTWLSGTELDVVFSGCQGDSYTTKQRVDLNISLTYYAAKTPSKPVHLVRGKIYGKIN